jgi:putative holliday junction resolvase
MFVQTGASVRTGVRLGVDPGSVRIGIARCDPAGILASPLTTVRRGKGDLRQIAALVRDEEAAEVVVGLPTSLSGKQTAAAEVARAFARSLAARLAPVPVRLVAERFTTTTAHSALRAGGRDSKARREVVDSAAAAVLLQSALDADRASGRPPGELVDPSEGTSA